MNLLFDKSVFYLIEGQFMECNSCNSWYWDVSGLGCLVSGFACKTYCVLSIFRIKLYKIPYSRSMSSISSRNSCSAAIKSCISLAANYAARTTAAPRAALTVSRTSHHCAVDSSARTSTKLSDARHSNTPRVCVF